MTIALIARPLRAQQPDTTAPISGTVEERLQQLDQKVRILERLRELERDSIAAAARNRVIVTANAKDGFSFKSADGKYQIHLRGLLQADTRLFAADNAALGTDQFLLRRARPYLEATLDRYLAVRFQPDFGLGTAAVFDAYADIIAWPALQLRAGKFKPPLGLERLQAVSDIAFAERALPSNLVPSRDLGVQLSGDLGKGRLAWQASVLDGAVDGANGSIGDGDATDAKDVAGRIFVQPFATGALSGLSLGFGGSTGIERGTVTGAQLPFYRSPGQVTVFRYRSDGTAAGTAIADGRRARLFPQAYFYYGPVGLMGEYGVSRQTVRRATNVARLAHKGWQVTGSLTLTGESASFVSITPRKPFDLKAHTFGALEVVGRYSRLDLDAATFPTFADPASAVRTEKAWAVGVNWYLLRRVKLVADYERTTFVGGATTGDREAEQVVTFRYQHYF